MDTLKEGCNGADVTRLQTQLQAKGFPPGAIDGNFGPGTEAAVIAFQRSEDLVADGVVGPRTAAALGFPNQDLPPAPAMPNVTVAVVARMFPYTPLGNINKYLPTVLTELVKASITGLPLVLAALGTIRAETEGFEPIDEGISRYNTSPNGHPFDLYDYNKKLGNLGPPDGERFKGRGFVQLTGRANYTRFGPIVGLDLVANPTSPDQANDPIIASKLLAAFINSKRTMIANALARNDFARAREAVNGGDHDLDKFTDAYQIGMKLLG
jgi:putative chitinase